MQRYGSLLDALVGLSWPARRPVAAAAPGIHPSRLRGMTAEFTEYRLYRQGDDPRRLDWKLLARTDRPYLRITDDHAIRSTAFLLDGSASMAFPDGDRSKWHLAGLLAIGLAAVSGSSGDPVGLTIVAGSGVTRLPPRSRRGVLGEMTRALEATQAGGGSILSRELPQPRRVTRLVLISDFLGPDPDLLRRSAQLVVQGTDVYALHLVADEELEPPTSPRLAIDPEEENSRRVLHGGVLGEYRRRFDTWRSGVASEWRSAGIEYHEVRTGDDPAVVIRRLVRGP